MLDIITEWENERKRLRELDWKHTPVYQLYQDFKGKGIDFQKYLVKHHPGIYTDVELKHYTYFLKTKIEITDPKEQQDIVLDLINPAIHTLRVLMTLVGLEFHFNRIYEKVKSDYTV